MARSGGRKPHRRLPLRPGCGDSDDEEEEGTIISAMTPGTEVHLLFTVDDVWTLCWFPQGKDHQHRVGFRDHRQRRAGQLLRRQGRGDRAYQSHGEGVREPEHQCKC